MNGYKVVATSLFNCKKIISNVYNFELIFLKNFKIMPSDMSYRPIRNLFLYLSSLPPPLYYNSNKVNSMKKANFLGRKKLVRPL